MATMPRKPYSYIEPQVQPLVEVLNRIEGVRTIASCEGHFCRIDHPYVYFHCQPPVAEMISRCLHEAHLQGTFHRWWRLTGMFNETHTLCFVLEAPSLHHRGSLFSAFINFVLLRHKVDDDLRHLSRVLEQLVDNGGQST